MHINIEKKKNINILKLIIYFKAFLLISFFAADNFSFKKESTHFKIKKFYC